jgi:hexosaminidase
VPAVRIEDRPRFAWRGFMLDTARHFFPPADVRRLIALAARYKLNRFHLGLANDQGWRLEIRSWPRLAEIGGSTQVGGGPGGFYTQEEYAGLAAYAAERFVTLVPEIDAPGHTHAALASYPELNCSAIAPPLYTGIEVGFSSLCIHKELTYRFLADVLGELAALTPGPYLHIGGDEAHATPAEDYAYFIERIQDIVRSCGKQMAGWEEIARSRLLPGTLVQQWKTADLQAALSQGARIIASPANRAYLDMKYCPESRLGLEWAGLVEVPDAYQWDPLSEYPTLAENDLAGVEGALWSETIACLEDAEYLAFPRLPGLAEIAWSPRGGRSWEEYRLRLAAHAPRLEALGIHYYPSPHVPWVG